MVNVVYADRVWLDYDDIKNSKFILTYIDEWGDGEYMDWTVEMGNGSDSFYLTNDIDNTKALDLLITQLTHLRNRVEMHGQKDTTV